MVGVTAIKRDYGAVDSQALKNFAPVVGFAWTPHFMSGLLGVDKTVIRGGFRIAYDPAFYNMFLNVATGAPREVTPYGNEDDDGKSFIYLLNLDGPVEKQWGEGANPMWLPTPK